MNRRRHLAPLITALALLGLLLGAGTGAAKVSHAPKNRALPRVTGSPFVGRTLVASHGRWTRHPRGYSFRWLACNAAGKKCRSIPHARSARYTLRMRDLRARIRVAVPGLEPLRSRSGHVPRHGHGDPGRAAGSAAATAASGATPATSSAAGTTASGPAPAASSASPAPTAPATATAPTTATTAAATTTTAPTAASSASSATTPAAAAATATTATTATAT